MSSFQSKDTASRRERSTAAEATYNAQVDRYSYLLSTVTSLRSKQLVLSSPLFPLWRRNRLLISSLQSTSTEESMERPHLLPCRWMKGKVSPPLSTREPPRIKMTGRYTIDTSQLQYSTVPER